MAMAFTPPFALIAATVASFKVATQSHKILPPDVCSNNARWPMAKPAPMPVTPGS